MKQGIPAYLFIFLASLLLYSCEKSEDGTSLVNLNITPAAVADKNSSYRNSKPDIYIDYQTINAIRPEGVDTGNLLDAIAYLDADSDGDTDVFMATGEYLSEREHDSILALNDGFENFVSSTAEFSGNMPQALHARKTIVSDFDGDGLKDMFIFDHGFDAFPFPGAEPKLILQTKVGKFSWFRMPDVGFFHGGAAADIDNDGDSDIFVGGDSPFFYINDGSANFERVNNRFDGSIGKVFSAELIDVDKDGFVDLLVGAHERDGDQTSIYWGNSTGAYSKESRFIVPATPPYGAVLDFVAEDLNGDTFRDIVINRTRDGDDGEAGGFYSGRTLQLLISNGDRSFTDATADKLPLASDDNPDTWFPWLRAQDYEPDGDIDLMSDDKGDNILYLNDGSGNFTLTPLTP